MANEPVKDNRSLEYWITRACDPFLDESERPQFISGFCEQVNEELEGHLVACRLLAHRIQSPHEAEALNALKVLESCFRQCGQRFHNEVAKYRFLNELIKVVSPKYRGNQTSTRVKLRIMEILYTLQISLKHLPKLKQVYDMLKDQGVIAQDPTYLENLCDTRCLERESAPRRSPFESDEKSEEEQKQEREEKRASDMKAIESSVHLLSEMINRFDPHLTTVHDMEVINDLAVSIEKMRTSLFQYAAEAGESEDVLGASNNPITSELMIVVEKPRTNGSVIEQKSTTSSEDINMLGVGNSTSAVNSTTAVDGGSDSSSALIELEDVFGIRGDRGLTSSNLPTDPRDNPSSFIMQNFEGNDLVSTSKALPDLKPKNKGLADLQHLSEKLIEQNLPRGLVSTAKSQQKRSLNELSSWNFSKVKPTCDRESAAEANANLIATLTSDCGDDVILVDSVLSLPVSENSLNGLQSATTSSKEELAKPSLNQLDYVFVPLEKVIPEKSSVTVLDKDNLKIVLYQTRNRPAENIVVLLFWISSTNVEEVTNIAFDITLQRLEDFACKLQPADAESLPAFNPISPLISISRVLLVLSRHSIPDEVSCRVSQVGYVSL
ncbi:unnamed protein product [Soboliphyme baturini]|uniref:VHS domain-containing protein n=1 Tax=Soboliphyme baturini TaxID=241478 RepID=A0A183IEC9_9BILA|nr:unnamed protein product [Soboliphyme baturini]